MNRAPIALIALLAYFFETALLLGGFGPGGQRGSCRSREQYSINADVIGAAVSREFAEREKAKAAKKTATPRPGVDGLPLLVRSRRDKSPRCGGIRRLKRTLPPDAAGA